MERMPFVRHPWYPQSAYLHRGGRLHAPVPDAMGDDSGYTYGTFSSKTPYAFVPKHTGLDGYYGYGDDASAPGCGAAELVDKIMSALPSKVKVDYLLDSMEIDLAPFAASLKSQLYTFINAQINNLAALANQGAGAITGLFVSKVSGPIVTAILAQPSLPPWAKNLGATLFGSVLDNVLKKQLYKVGEIIASCAGPAPIDLTAPQVDPNVCVDAGMYANDTGLVLPSGQKMYQCSNAPAQSMTDFAALLSSGQTAQMNISELNSRRPNAALVGQLMTWAQWDAQCKAAGGAISVQADGSHLCYDPYTGTIPTGTTPAATTATGGAGGVAILGGVALLALLLLR